MCSGSMPPERRNAAVDPVAQKEDVRRRRRLVNGQAERREDRARLLERHGAAARELQQGRSVEARQHDAEAPLQGHLAEHLRRRAAGGEDGAGHSRLVPADPLRDAGLEQLHDLTGRPGVDVREDAFADLLPQGSPHRPSSAARSKHRRRAKKNPPIVAAAGCGVAHDRFWHKTDLRECPSNVRFRARNRHPAARLRLPVLTHKRH